jgi:ribonuclease P protein component
VITSRKVGSAVERTRTRRRLREIFRLHRGGLPPGLWMVVVARRAAAVANFSALRGEWRELAVRAGYLQA